MTDQHLRSSPDAVNLELPYEYDASPEVLRTPEPGQGGTREGHDRDSGPEASEGKVWGMKRKVFIIVLGVIAILIIAVAAGVGWGVGVAGRNNNSGTPKSTTSRPREPSETTTPKPPDSPVPTDFSYVS